MIFDPVLDLFRGKAVTIPPMDGAFRPNTALDEASVLVEIPEPDNLAFDGARLLFSTGNEIRAISQDGEESTRVFQDEAMVTALAAGDGRALAVAFDDGRIALRGGPHDGLVLNADSFGGLACVTALVFWDQDSLMVTQGSERYRATDWALDLMEKGATGSLWRVDLAKRRCDRVARHLAFPNGILIEPERIVVSESWRHRLSAVPLDGGEVRPILKTLPGYPSRLSPAEGGGAWLAIFAPRNRLIEFVLLEDEYRSAMINEVPRENWIAPALSSNLSFLEPLQCGSVKAMGIHKPWSPTRSYGLVVRLNTELRPITSFHSRANGKRHGVTSVATWNGRVVAAAKGGNAIIEVVEA